MKKIYFNVFDGEYLHTVEQKEIVNFLSKFNSPLSIQLANVSETKVIKGRIKLTPSKHSFVARSKVKASTNISSKKVVAIAKNHKRKVFETIAECSKVLKIDDSNISKVLKGKRKTANGYRFEYI